MNTGFYLYQLSAMPHSTCTLMSPDELLGRPPPFALTPCYASNFITSFFSSCSFLSSHSVPCSFPKVKIMFLPQDLWTCYCLGLECFLRQVSTQPAPKPPSQWGLPWLPQLWLLTCFIFSIVPITTWYSIYYLLSILFIIWSPTLI
jgi:hypothetical protein